MKIEAHQKSYSMADIVLARDAPDEIKALGEALKLAAPGVKMPQDSFASIVDRMLRKRGYCVAKLPEKPL